MLVFLPDICSKLLLACNGPYIVLERKNRVNYVIEEKGKLELYHANLLKRYYRYAHVNQATVLDEVSLPGNAQDPLELTFSLYEPEFPEVADDLPITPGGRAIKYSC